MADNTGLVRLPLSVSISFKFLKVYRAEHTSTMTHVRTAWVYSWTETQKTKPRFRYMYAQEMWSYHRKWIINECICPWGGLDHISSLFPTTPTPYTHTPTPYIFCHLREWLCWTGPEHLSPASCLHVPDRDLVVSTDCRDERRGLGGVGTQTIDMVHMGCVKRYIQQT